MCTEHPLSANRATGVSIRTHSAPSLRGDARSPKPWPRRRTAKWAPATNPAPREELHTETAHSGSLQAARELGSQPVPPPCAIQLLLIKAIS